VRKRILIFFIAWVLLISSFSSCIVLQQGSKNGFNDGIYKTRRFYGRKVYVLKVDEDTIAVFPVLDFKDSTAILVKQRVNYTSRQRRMKDNLSSYSFYKPSFDIDLMTEPLKYRPPTNMLPNQLTANFNGALYGGYRIDAYKLNYKRTPLNIYKQSVKHTGYSAGLFAGIGSTLIDNYSLTNPAINTQYEGVLLITGFAVNVAVQNLTLGVSLGTDHLLDKNRSYWIYEGKPCVGFTVGLNLK
jgi:hypothetical protein